MEVKDAVKRRRSIRKYLDKEVSNEIINELIEAARLAPSAYNAQPWKFKIINNKNIINELKENNVFKNSFVYTVPLLIVCCADIDAYPERAKDNFNTRELSLIDLSLANQNLILRATELGLGTCYIGLLNEEKIKNILKIPDKMVIPYVVCVGYPNENPNPTPRKNTDEIITR